MTLALGRKGLGKSYWIKRELDKLRPHAPLVVWDFNREYAGARGKDPIRNATVFASLAEFARAQAAQKGHVGRAVIHAYKPDFERFCKFCLDCGGLTVVIDELHVYVDAHTYPQSFEDLLYVGRHRRIDVVCASWRPYGLPVFLRSAADEIRAFQTTEPRDLKWFRDNCGEVFANQLPSLPARRSLLWTGVRSSAFGPTTKLKTPRKGSR